MELAINGFMGGGICGMGGSSSGSAVFWYGEEEKPDRRLDSARVSIRTMTTSKTPVQYRLRGLTNVLSSLPFGRNSCHSYKLESSSRLRTTRKLETSRSPITSRQFRMS